MIQLYNKWVQPIYIDIHMTFKALDGSHTWGAIDDPDIVSM